MKIEQTNQENLSSISQQQQQYIQMANLTSGSSFCSSTSSSSSNPSRSSFRTNLKTTDFNKNDQDQDSNAVYNFPWEFKPKTNPLIAQLTNNQSSSIPPPLPSVPPPQTPKIAENTNSHIESQDESQYCAPWDLKLQEEMLKLMAQNQNSTNTNNNNTNSISSSNKKSNEEKLKTDSFKRNDSNSSSFRLKNEISITSTSNMSTTNNTSVTKTDAESSEYSPPWEHKQSILFQQISNNNLKQSTSQLPPPLATSSASSTLNNPTTSSSTNQSNAMSSLFNKFSLTRLSNRSNNSSSSSTRSSTSSLSASSPPSMPPPSLPPPILPPPPPPASTLPTNQSSSTLQTCNSLRCVNTNNQQQQQSPHLIHRQLSQVGHSGQTCGFMHVQNMNNLVLNQNILQSNYLNDKSKFSTTNSSVFDTLASNVNSVLDETKQILRQNRAGSSHGNQFTFPNQQQFQTISTGDIQVSALPVTALVFSANNNSLPNGILPLNVTVQQQQQQVAELSSPSKFNDLERQSWFHGRITRKQAENLLNNKPIGSFLVRQSESGNSNDYSLSLVIFINQLSSGSGCVHMRICMKNGEFILGQCSQPFTSIVKMIDHYGRVEVPIKGAQHVKLSTPIRTSG